MSPDAVTDLIERARDGACPMDRRHAAFGELVRLFEGMATASALRLVDDPEAARDAIQEAFLAAWTKLGQLRAPEAFGSWLKRLVSTECRRYRRSHHSSRTREPGTFTTVRCEFHRREREGLLVRALAGLPEREQRVIVFHYFLGHKIDEIAALEGIPRATVGKRLYDARLRIRRRLPPSIREEFVRPSLDLVRRAREGLLDDYVGEYHFEQRPDLVVKIVRERENGVLVSYGRGSRNVLVPVGDGILVTAEFDGEGRFERDECGRVTRFVYYEFGERLGVAVRCHGATGQASRAG